jgi:hypothetical protein
MKKIRVLILSLVVHIAYLTWRLSCLSEVCFRCFRNLQEYEFDISFVNLKNASECYVLQHSVHAGKEIYVNGSGSVSTEKRITAFSLNVIMLIL